MQTIFLLLIIPLLKIGNKEERTIGEKIVKTWSGANKNVAVKGTNELPGISIADMRIVEGNAGQRSAEVSVIISQIPTSSVSVMYNTRNGSASDGSDYTAANGSLFFAKGEMMKKIKVAIKGEVVCEPNEDFEILLSNATGVVLADSIGIATIVNDDCAGSNNMSIYEVRLTHTGYATFAGSPADCPIRSNGKVILTGLLSGAENVPQDEDIRYTGTLQLDLDIDICSSTLEEDPNGGYPLCGITVIGSGDVKAELEIYMGGRGAYIKINNESGRFKKTAFGSCDQRQKNEELNIIPNGTIANIFNGRDLPMLVNRTLVVGRYVETDGGNETVVEVLRKIR